MSGLSSLGALDHRRLGQRLGLFVLDAAVGKGLPLWLPKGTAVRDELERLARELEFKAGFQRVATPHIARTDLYRASGAEHVERELGGVLDMYAEVYALLGIEGHHFRLSRRAASDERAKYVDDPQAWSWAEGVLQSVLEQRGIAYEDGPGHAAFYGPKIDVQVRTLGGAEETLSTVQLDFAQPARLGLSYTAASGRPEIPFCIHRAPLSTHERLVAFLLELYGGAFPTWLAPVQVLVIPVSERSLDHAERIVQRLRARLVRVELGSAAETVARRVRDAAEQKIPNVIVVGPREVEAQAVTLRRFGRAGQVRLGVEELERRLLDAIARRLRCVEVG